jgi:hypothetical protein
MVTEPSAEGRASTAAAISFTASVTVSSLPLSCRIIRDGTAVYVTFGWTSQVATEKLNSSGEASSDSSEGESWEPGEAAEAAEAARFSSRSRIVLMRPESKRWPFVNDPIQ